MRKVETFSVNTETDKELLEHLSKVGNKSDYIKSLILLDMKDEDLKPFDFERRFNDLENKIDTISEFISNMKFLVNAANKGAIQNSAPEEIAVEVIEEKTFDKDAVNALDQFDL